MTSGGVTIVIPTKSPDAMVLKETMRSLDMQTVPPEKVIIVDSSDSKIATDSRTFKIELIRVKRAGIGFARRVGVMNVDTEFTMHLDEDGILLEEDHIERCLHALNDIDVVAAGCRVAPIRGNDLGNIISILESMSPQVRTIHYLVHKTDIMKNNIEEFLPRDGRTDDIDMRKAFKRRGKIKLVEGLVALKDLPTTRQRRVLDGLTALSIGSALIRG